MNYLNKRNRQYRRFELRAHRLRGLVFQLSTASILFMLGAYIQVFFVNIFF